MAEGGAPTSLSGPTLEKAMRELNEPGDDETRSKLINELRRRLENWQPKEKNEEGINFERLDDDKFLLRFLRTKKFDLNRAEQLYINYHTVRRKHSELLGEISLQSAEGVIRSGIITVLPHRTTAGCRVLVARPNKWDMDTVRPEEILKALLVVLDKLLEEEETQVHGIVVFENFEGLPLVQILHLAKTEPIKKGVMLELIQVSHRMSLLMHDVCNINSLELKLCIQEAFPARFKGIHLINQPWYISILMTILMPFMKQKLRGQVCRQYFVVVYVVSNNMSYRSICMEQNSPLCTIISQQNIYLKSLEASSPPLIVTLLHHCFKNCCNQTQS